MTDRYAVFGNPIEHSKSPELQMAFAQQTEQDILYTKQCVALDGFKAAITDFQQTGGKGLNITVPFKLEAYTLADTLTERAKLAHAVNTLLFQPDGTLLGDNTDGVGLINDMKETYGWQIKGKRILVLGAGGAVRGLLGSLLDEQPDAISLLNRTYSKAIDLANTFHQPQLNAVEMLNNETFDIIINGTSASLQGQELALPGLMINTDTCCYDMMYSNDLTPFLSWAKSQGMTKLADGLGMLVHQGAESFRLWRGITPETKLALQYLRDLVTKSARQ